MTTPPPYPTVQQAPPPPARKSRLPWIIGAAVAALVVLGGTGIAIAAARGEGGPVKGDPPRRVAPAAASVAPAVGNTVAMQCSPANGAGQTVTVSAGAGGYYNFGQAWALQALTCEVRTVNGNTSEDVSPATAVEKKAFDASGYKDDTRTDGDNIATLFELCGAAGPEETYASETFAASDAQAAEITGALTLCPAHPLASQWRASIERGKTPEPATTPAPAGAAGGKAAKLSDRQWKKIAKSPDDFIGKKYVIYGVVTQFDSATGDEQFRADVGPRNMGESYEYDTNSILSAIDLKIVADLVEDDEFRAEAVVMGANTYETTLGGEMTVPWLMVTKVKVL